MQNAGIEQAEQVQHFPVHCYLDCLAYALRREGKREWRPLYFGAWDAPFSVSEEGTLTYYSADLSCEKELEVLKKLYERTPDSWYDYGKTREANYRELTRQVRKDGQACVILLVNLFYLPYSNGCYGVLHRPHFVIVDHFRQGEWYVRDPYFAWEGYVSENTLALAFYRKELFAGFRLDPAVLGEPGQDRIFALCDDLLGSENILAATVCRFVERAGSANGEFGWRQLALSLQQLGVLAKRKNSYRYAISYLGSALTTDLSALNPMVDRIVKGWHELAFLSLRLAAAERPGDSVKILDKANQLQELETALKEKLRRTLREDSAKRTMLNDERD